MSFRMGSFVLLGYTLIEVSSYMSSKCNHKMSWDWNILCSEMLFKCVNMNHLLENIQSMLHEKIQRTCSYLPLKADGYNLIICKVMTLLTLFLFWKPCLTLTRIVTSKLNCCAFCNSNCSSLVFKTFFPGSRPHLYTINKF